MVTAFLTSLFFTNQIAGLCRFFCCFKSCCSKETLSDHSSRPIVPNTKSQPDSVSIPTALNKQVTLKVTMAPGIMSPVPGNLSSPLYSKFPGSSRKVSTMSAFDSDSLSNSGISRPSNSRRESSFVSKKFTSVGSSKLSGVIQALQRQSGAELGVNTHSTLFNTDHATILEWIATERMSHLPPEGSSYDKVLAWAQLFVERLHSFDVAIRDFEGSSWLAAQLSYGYCAMLLEVRNCL